MIKRSLIVLAVLLVLGGLGLYVALRSYQTASRAPDFFEDAIVAFEEADRANPPAPGAIVFVGSSSIRMWDSLEADMAPLRVLERGFGGAHLSHVIHNAHRIILPYAPEAVVVYAGDNDLAAGSGKTVEEVVGDFRTLTQLLHEARPELPIYFVAIKPSTSRWEQWGDMSEANRRIAAIADADPRIGILDIATPMLAGGSGPPADELFLLDGLHLTDSGYAIWTDAIKPKLLSAHPPKSREPGDASEPAS